MDLEYYNKGPCRLHREQRTWSVAAALVGYHNYVSNATNSYLFSAASVAPDFVHINSKADSGSRKSFNSITPHSIAPYSDLLFIIIAPLLTLPKIP
jgi:hypothetical protein